MVCSGVTATASCVPSSTIARHFNVRPDAMRSKTKSIDQTSFACPGRISGCRSAMGIFLRRRRRIQVLEPIQALDSLVIGWLASLPKLQVDHANAIASMTLCQSDDPLTQLLVAVRPRLVTQRARTHVHDLKTPPLRQTLRLHPPHQLATRRCGHHFFLSASRVTSFSSIDSASNFFRRAFSASSLRYSSLTGTPLSASFKNPMICSSVNRFFTSNLHRRG